MQNAHEFWKGWEVISRYTRAEAIADGVLVDLGTFTCGGRPLLSELGFRLPVAITAAAFGMVTEHRAAADIRISRLLYLLAYLKSAIKASGPDADRVDFTLKGLGSLALYAVCGPGDNAEPVITIMLPGED